VKDTFFAPAPSINCQGLLIDFSTPVVMGIINCTPDSFYEGSRKTQLAAATETAMKMVHEGAAMLDIGGYSTRPGADEVSEDEELERVIPVIEAVRKALPETIISIDTFRGKVAREAVAAGACIVNDVSGFEADPSMAEALADLRVPYVLMHSRGNPKTMTSLTSYTDLIGEMMIYFSEKLAQLRQWGVSDVIIDPGFGFAKTPQQGFEILRHLPVFQSLGCPVLAGLSRKSMIWKTLNTDPGQALNGTTVLNTIALQQGVSILRVHDVKAATEAVKLVGQFNRAQGISENH
jgi:dihydropteroate synthase